MPASITHVAIHARDLERKVEREYAADRYIDILLIQLCEAVLCHRHDVTAGRYAENSETPVRIGRKRSAEIGCDVLRLDHRTGNHCSLCVGNDTLDRAGGDVLGSDVECKEE
jgi:hypothetical protein